MARSWEEHRKCAIWPPTIILALQAFTQEEELVMLSLKTLATFNMKGMVMLPFVRNVVIEYLKIQV